MITTIPFTNSSSRAPLYKMKIIHNTLIFTMTEPNVLATELIFGLESQL